MRTRKDGGEISLGKEKDVKLKCQGIQEHKLTLGDPASQKTTPSTIVHPACNWVDLCPTNNAHDLSIPWKPLQSLWHLQDPQSRGWRPEESHGMIYNLKEKSQPLTKEGPEGVNLKLPHFSVWRGSQWNEGSGDVGPGWNLHRVQCHKREWGQFYK